jgi:hypothetical protein
VCACVLSLFTFPCVLNWTVSVDQYKRNCKQEIHTPTQKEKCFCKSELILNWYSIFDLDLQTNNRNHGSILCKGSSLQITVRTAPAAVCERIMFRKAVKNFEMPEDFVELEMYFEVSLWLNRAF